MGFERWWWWTFDHEKKKNAVVTTYKQTYIYEATARMIFSHKAQEFLLSQQQLACVSDDDIMKKRW